MKEVREFLDPVAMCSGAVTVALYAEEASCRCFSRTSRRYGALSKKVKALSNSSMEVVNTNSGSCVGSGDVLS